MDSDSTGQMPYQSDGDRLGDANGQGESGTYGSTGTANQGELGPNDSAGTAGQNEPSPYASASANDQNDQAPYASTGANSQNEPSPYASTGANSQNEPSPYASAGANSQNDQAPYASTGANDQNDQAPYASTGANDQNEPTPYASAGTAGQDYAPNQYPAGVADPTLVQAAYPDPEDYEPIIPERLPSYDEEHGRAIGEGYDYEPDYSRLDRAYQPEPQREIRIPHIADEDGAGHMIPGEGKSRSKVRPFLAFVLVAGMVAGIAAAGSYGLELWGGKRIPNVVGLSERQAREELEAKGFTVESRTSLADDGIGYVLEQLPAGGQRVEESTRVDIVVAVSREMPAVEGLTQAEAEDLLRKAGAEEIKVVAQNAAQEEGTVISVTPAPGEGFSAHQTITLVVSSKTPVPDVTGKNKVEAVAAIENAGYKVETTEVESDKPQNTVVEQSPEPGSKLDPGATVTLKLARPKMSNPLHLAEFFSQSSESLAKTLTKQGFSFNSGHQLGDGYGEAEYISSTQGRLIFAVRPFSHIYEGTAKEDILSQGIKFRGVRWEVPSSMLPQDASSLSQSAIESLMSTCGLNNLMETCTDETIVIPAEAVKTGAKLRCAYGETNGNSWTVLLVNENGSTRAVVTCAPRSLYLEWYDLESYGNSICNMIAYADAYTELY